MKRIADAVLGSVVGATVGLTVGTTLMLFIPPAGNDSELRILARKAVVYVPTVVGAVVGFNV